MKNTSFFLLLLFALGLFACDAKKEEAQEAKDLYTLKGKINGFDSNTMTLIAVDLFGQGQAAQREINVAEDGSFKDTFDIKAPQPFLLALQYYDQLEDKDKLMVFLEEGQVDLKASAENFSQAKVKHSNSQMAYNEYVQKIETFNTRLQEIEVMGGQQTDPAELEKLAEEQGKWMKMRYEYLETFVRDHKTSPAGTYVLMTQLLEESQLPLMEEVLEAQQFYKGKSPWIDSLDEIIEKIKPFAVGNVAPDFTLPTAEGDSLTLSEMRGKVVLLDFWASWCMPCRLENPNVKDAYAKYKDRGFEVFGVSLDEDAEKWKKAIQEDGITWKQTLDLAGTPRSVGQLYQIQAIPKTFLLDREGKIIAKDLRGPQLEEKLAEIFGE